MHKIDMEKEYVVGVDIGSSKVTMAVGTRNSNGEVSVLGVESRDVGESVKNGDIMNYVLLGKTIADMKATMEQEFELDINSAYVGMSGRSVYCVRYEDEVEISNPTGCVRQNEMRELQNRIDMVTSSSGDDIVDRIPLRYRIDGMQEVKNPIGSYGRKLSATYLFVMISTPQVDMVRHALFQAHLQIAGLTVNPIVSPLLLVNKQEAEDGVLIVDIGSDLTDISIVRENKVWYFSSLPIGASSISEDLYQFLHISKRDIDKIKHRYGSAIAESIPENTSFSVQTSGRGKRQILQRNVAEIIEERLKDITYFVDRELKGAKFINKVPCGVVLTGGSAYLQNIDELFARELKMEARLGNIFNGIDYDSYEKVCYPDSAAVGLLLYGAAHVACDVKQTGTPIRVIPPVEQPMEDTVSVVKKADTVEDVTTPSTKQETNVVAEQKDVEEDKSEEHDTNNSDETQGEKEITVEDNTEKTDDTDDTDDSSESKSKNGWLTGLLGWARNGLDRVFEKDDVL